MKRNPLTIVVAALLALLFVLLLFLFKVRQTEVAVVTTFGRATRAVVEPGPYLKWPWPIQDVHKFDKRIQNFESPFEQVLTPDGYNLLISVYAGWRISDPRIFYPLFGGSTTRAEESLQGLIRNAYSGVVGKHPFAHFISTDTNELKFTDIEREILEKIQVDARARNYGIEVAFLGIRKLGLPESVTQLVFERMQSERQVLESKIKYEGEREASAIRSAADLESSKKLYEAEARAQQVRAEGEKEALRYYKVFNQEPELATFLIKLSGLEAFLKQRSTLILDQNTPGLELLRAGSSITAPSVSLSTPSASLGTNSAEVTRTKTRP